MSYPAQPNSGKQLEKLRSGRNALFVCALLISGDALMKSTSLTPYTGYIPDWASWILATALFVGAAYVALKVIALEG